MHRGCEPGRFRPRVAPAAACDGCPAEDAQSEPGQRHANAGVDAHAEGDVVRPLLIDPELVGVVDARPSRLGRAVQQPHARVQSGGGEVVHAPRVFPEYPPPYYATFWLDPFGIMLEAVCRYDRD